MTKFLTATLLLLCWAPTAHDFHISKTTIRYVEDREQIQIEMHIFLDDLELALQDAGSPKLYIGTENELTIAAETVARYVDRHFKLNWNGVDLPVGFLGYELSEDLQALWIYLQAKSRDVPESITVQNTVLTEIYDDQRNLVKVVGQRDHETTLLLSRDQPTAKHTF